MLVFTMVKIKAHSDTNPQYPTFLSLSQADLSYGIVLLYWLQSHRPMYLEAIEYSLPVNWAVTGLFWTLIYGLFNLPWWSNAGHNGKISLMSCGDWASRGFTSFLLLHQGFWARPVAKWSQKLGTQVMKACLTGKCYSFLSVVLSEREHPVLLTKQVPGLGPSCQQRWGGEGWKYSQAAPSTWDSFQGLGSKGKLLVCRLLTC